MKAISTIILWLLCPSVWTQQLFNGDFNNFNFGSSPDCQVNTGLSSPTNVAPFQIPNCYVNSSWYVSHGTPEVGKNLPPSNNQFGFLWTGDFTDDNSVYGEGLFIQCYFKQSKVYRFKFKLATSGACAGIDNPLDHFYVSLTNQLTHQLPYSYIVNSGAYDIPTPTDEQEILHITNFTSTTFITQDFYFVPDQDYADLWLYPQANNYPICITYIDDVELVDCIPFQVYANNSSLPALTLREIYIESNQNVNVLNGQNVTFNAGEYIDINSGFETQDGAIFEAFIQGCDNVYCAINDIRSSEVNTNPTERNDFTGNTIKASHTELYKQLIHPNPANDFITVNMMGDELSVEIINSVGQNVKQVRLQNNYKVDVSELPAGMYFISVYEQETLVYSDKLVISK